MEINKMGYGIGHVKTHLIFINKELTARSPSEILTLSNYIAQIGNNQNLCSCLFENLHPGTITLRQRYVDVLRAI